MWLRPKRVCLLFRNFTVINFNVLLEIETIIKRIEDKRAVHSFLFCGWLCLSQIKNLVNVCILAFLKFSVIFWTFDDDGWFVMVSDQFTFYIYIQGDLVFNIYMVYFTNLHAIDTCLLSVTFKNHNYVNL